MSRILICAPRHGFCWTRSTPATTAHSRQDAAPGEWNPGAVSGEG